MEFNKRGMKKEMKKINENNTEYRLWIIFRKSLSWDKIRSTREACDTHSPRTSSSSTRRTATPRSRGKKN